MLREVSRLLLCELQKVWRTKLPYIGLACNALMAFGAKQSVESFGQPGEVTAFNYFSSALILSATLTTPIFTTIFAALSVASETSNGTLRTILVRPVARWHFLTAKLLASLLYLATLVATNIAVALLIARGYPLRAPLERLAEPPSLSTQLAIFALGIGLSLLPQLATLSFGFMVSVLVARGGSAVGIALGLLFTLTAAKQFISVAGYELSTFVFSTYYDLPMKIADARAEGIHEAWLQDRMLYMFGTSLLATVLFLAVSYWVFLRRDLNA